MDDYYNHNLKENNKLAQLNTWGVKFVRFQLFMMCVIRVIKYMCGGSMFIS